MNESLDEIVGTKFQRDKYKKYNRLDSIRDVIAAYNKNTAVAGGAYKFYNEETVEMKRIFVEKTEQGRGLGKELIKRLEAEAMVLYKKLGYKVIPNYGQYADMAESICMSRKL